MTTYTTLNETTQLGSDRIATSPTVLALYRNLLAVLEGDASAPRVDTVALQTAAVTQPKLKTTTGDVSVGFTVASHQTLPGGEYGFYPLTWISGGNATVGQVIISNPVGNVNTSPVALIYLDATGMSQGNLNARQRYVQSSPPYNLGNGDIPLFVFALLDGAGKVMSSYVAPEPPWAYNGPTDIRPDFYKNGKPFQRPRLSVRQRLDLLNPQKLEAVLLDIAKAPEVEITHAIKNADMPLVPHPFVRDLAGLTVVQLDMLTGLGDELAVRHDAGESICELLHDGRITIDNVSLDCMAPPGVMPVAARWK